MTRLVLGISHARSSIRNFCQCTVIGLSDGARVSASNAVGRFRADCASITLNFITVIAA
jgi:hypothetical protein